MKYISTVTFIVYLFMACKEAAHKQVAPSVQKDPTTIVAIKKDFSGIIFESKKDLACGMPLTAGLEDSVHYKGKIYGFCSPECKADFIKNASVYVK